MWLCAVCTASADNVHAWQVPAGLHVPEARPDKTGPPVYCHTDTVSRRSVGHQIHQGNFHHLSDHGAFIRCFA